MNVKPIFYKPGQSISFGGFSGDANNNGGTLALSDFFISFTGVKHAQLYGPRLDQSDRA